MRSNGPLEFRSYIKYALICLGVIVFVGYTLFQARLLITGPVIDLLDEPGVEQSERVVKLQGYAQNIVKITLNGRAIYTDKNGYFKEALILENGYTKATLEGTDRYGRTTQLEKTFVFTSTVD